MAFKLNAYLPSKKQDVQIAELCYKQYRELVKSLYNVNKKETIQQYNLVLQELCSDISDIDITFEDKLSLLLVIRNFCVSPDLKLKGTPQNGASFSYSITVDKLIQEIKTIEKSGIVHWNDVTVEYSSYKARDEHVFLGNNKDIFVVLASCIDNIKIGKQNVLFRDLRFEERLKIVNSLPHVLSNQVYKNILTLEQNLNAQNFLVITNPVDKEVALRISKNITFEILQKIIELIFTEDLNNIYRAFYNMVKYAGFSPAYLDSITPVEIQV